MGLIGANGAGKTTLMRSVSGLIRNGAAQITYRGQHIGAMAPHDIAGLGIALVPEGRQLFPSLSVEENRLVFRMKNVNGVDIPMLVLSLKPYKRLIKDYFLIVRSYDEAMREGKPSRIEAIDMGRRGLHNEGAEALQERLLGKVEMDFDTARRLFTLICVLHAQNVHAWR